jgi:NADH dehydrogenase
MFASIGNHKAVGLVLGLRLSGLLAWLFWRSVYLSKMPTVARRLQVAFDWGWQLFFPRDIVQLNTGQTERFGRSHFEPGQFVFHKGDSGEKFSVIERGQAGVYLDEEALPVAVLGPGDHFGEAALLRSAPRSATVKAEERLDVLTVSRPAFSQLTSHLNVLRSSLERSFQRRWSSQRLLQAAKEQPQLTSRHVRDLMSRPVTTLPEGLGLADALERTRVERRGIYPIVDDAGRMVGVCTRTDFYDALQGLSIPQITLSEVMHQPVITVRESDSLMAALREFLREPVKRIVVVSDEDPTRPVGILTPFDILAGATDGASIPVAVSQSASEPG